jgi:hypothetical protein
LLLRMTEQSGLRKRMSVSVHVHEILYNYKIIRINNKKYHLFALAPRAVQKLIFHKLFEN